MIIWSARYRCQFAKCRQCPGLPLLQDDESKPNRPPSYQKTAHNRFLHHKTKIYHLQRHRQISHQHGRWRRPWSGGMVVAATMTRSCVCRHGSSAFPIIQSECITTNNDSEHGHDVAFMYPCSYLSQ